MIVKRVSDLTGVTHFREIKVTQAELDDWKNSGELIQNYFPDLSETDREFIRSGITPEEWDLYMGEPEDDEIVPPWIQELMEDGVELDIMMERDNE